MSELSLDKPEYITTNIIGLLKVAIYKLSSFEFNLISTSIRRTSSDKFISAKYQYVLQNILKLNLKKN